MPSDDDSLPVLLPPITPEDVLDDRDACTRRVVNALIEAISARRGIDASGSGWEAAPLLPQAPFDPDRPPPPVYRTVVFKFDAGGIVSAADAEGHTAFAKRLWMRAQKEWSWLTGEGFRELVREAGVHRLSNDDFAAAFQQAVKNGNEA